MPSKKPGKITFKGKIDPRLIPTDAAPGYEIVDAEAKVIRALEPLAVLLRNAVLTRADRLERAITSARTRKAKLEVIRKSDLEVLQMFADLVKPLKSSQNVESATKTTL